VGRGYFRRMKTYEIHTPAGKVVKIKAAGYKYTPKGTAIHFYGEDKTHLATVFVANVVALIVSE
jgi:hypothetical protein